MIQTIVTIGAAIVIGIVLGVIEIMYTRRKAKKEHNADVLQKSLIGKELIRRRGSWRFALDQILFSEEFNKQVQDEARIKVR